MGATDDGCKMMLAMGLKPDIAQHDHLVIALDLFEGASEEIDGIVGIAGEPILISPLPVRGYRASLRGWGHRRPSAIAFAPQTPLVHGMVSVPLAEGVRAENEDGYPCKGSDGAALF